MLTQNRIRVDGKLHIPKHGATRGSVWLPYVKMYIPIFIVNKYLGYSASHFLETIMHMSKVGNHQRGDMTQTRMRESSITLSIPSRRSLRDRYTFLISKSRNLKLFYFLLVLGNSISKNVWSIVIKVVRS